MIRSYIAPLWPHRGKYRLRLRFSGMVLIHVMQPLVIGCLIYLFFREPVSAEAFIPDWISIRAVKLERTGFLINALTGFLPDFLWAYAFGSYLIAWLPSNKVVAAATCVGFVGLAHEAGQYGFFFPGTFDPLDAMAYCLCVPILILVHKRPITNESTLNDFL